MLAYGLGIPAAAGLWCWRDGWGLWRSINAAGEVFVFGAFCALLGHGAARYYGHDPLAFWPTALLAAATWLLLALGWLASRPHQGRGYS